MGHISMLRGDPFDVCSISDIDDVEFLSDIGSVIDMSHDYYPSKLKSSNIGGGNVMGQTFATPRQSDINYLVQLQPLDEYECYEDPLNTGMVANGTETLGPLYTK